MDEIELRTELSMLKGQVEGLTWLIKGLVLALSRTGAADLRQVAETLAVVGTFVHHTESEVATIPFKSCEYFFDAILKNPQSDPLRGLLISALLHVDAGSEQKDALQTWLSQATEAEIAQELQQLFSQLAQRSEPGSSPGA